MNILMKGTVCFRGFEHLADIDTHLERNLPVHVEVFHCIAAGLHPDGTIIITKLEKP